MLQWLRRRWLLATSLVLLFVGGTVAGIVYWQRAQTIAEEQEEEEGALPKEPEAPPDLQKLKEPYLAGIEALQKKDAATAVEKLSSFTFGPRAVEEYRLYHLGRAYQLAGNAPAARATLAKLWMRSPRLAHAGDVAIELAGLYAASGDAIKSASVFTAAIPMTSDPVVTADARWNAALQRLQTGDTSGALYAARNIVIHNPRAKQAPEAAKLVRALHALPDNAALPLTPSERVDRAIALMAAEDSQTALEELTALEPHAPQLRSQIALYIGICLHRLKKYEDSNKKLEPLTSGPYKYAIPALRHAAKNYAILAASVNPEVIKTVKERKKVGTIKQRVGKGKKRRTVTKPKYQTVFRQIKLIDLAKKKKKDEWTRLSSERLKDLLQLPLDENTRLEVLNTLITRAAAKNQDEYVRELVPQVIQLDRQADPALQHFWDKGWAAYARGDLNGARQLFRYIADTYTHVNVRRQSDYWYARCLERLGQKEEAMAIYRRLASAPYEDLYAVHAITRGAPRRENKTNPLEQDGPDWQEIAEKQMPKELQLAYELTALSALPDAQLEIQRNAKRENAKFAEALLAEHYHAAGNEVAMYRSLRRAWPELATVEQDSTPKYFLRMYYPQKYADVIDERAKERGLDPNLVRALILQESYYEPKAKSRVGATGLMQLMPATAQDHAGRVGVRYSTSRLETPDYNVRLGTYHLRMLVDMFGGNTYLAVASYNAGQGNVMKWRRGAPRKPMDEFLESIPFQETRNYVKRVTMLRSAYSRLTL